MATPPIPYLTLPASIVNEALDRLGASSKIVGDITDGTAVAEAARRNYGRILRALLRTAHWPFARKMEALQMLGDATGQTANVSTYVESPWTYAYAWPVDAVAGRWMPAQPASTATPPDGTGPLLNGNLGPIFPPVPMLPVRFLVGSSDQYPVVVGDQDWTNQPDLQRTEGVGPISRKIILTDQLNALFVYTRLVTVIEEWDDLFREAMIASLAVILAPTAIEDPKVRIAERDRQLLMARNAIADARVASGNEAGFPQSVDHQPAWMTARNGGYWGAGLAGWGGAGFGTYGLYLPYEPYSLGGSVF